MNNLLVLEVSLLVLEVNLLVLEVSLLVLEVSANLSFSHKHHVFRGCQLQLI